jgi:hypothetical protein
MNVMVEEGELPIYCSCIQRIIKRDWEGLSKNLDIMKRKTFPRSQDFIMQLDLNSTLPFLKKTP